MRISTSTLYDVNVASINRQQEALLHTQQQISTGRRVLTPADDPIAAARALEVSQAAATNTQHGVNRDTARSALSLTDKLLGSVTDLLQNVRTQAVYGGSGTLSDADRNSLALDLQSRLSELFGLANSTDGSGLSVFSGYQTGAPAFVQTATGVKYNGDEGRRLIQVSASRQLQVSESGQNVFGNIKTGNGVFTASADAANTGAGTISTGSVTNAAALTGHNYRVDFSVAAGATSYSVVDTTTSTTLSTGNPYTPGTALGFDGLQFTLDGAPANGDRFTVAPSVNQSVFETVSQLISTLKAPGGGAANAARLTNGINAALSNLDQSLDHVLNVRAGIGARLNEVDALDNNGLDLGLQFKQTLSKLQDVDYASAISQLTQQQASLDAAQKSFVKVSGLSLFNYL